MKKRLCCLLSLLLCVSFCVPMLSCAPENNVSRTYYTMDTFITVTLYADADTGERLLDACGTILSELNSLWSRTEEESDVSALNTANGMACTMDARTVTLLQTAMEVSQRTGGAFDVTILPVVILWQECEAAGRLPTDTELEHARSLVGYDRITLTSASSASVPSDMGIDLGGIGKGAAISVLIEYLREHDACGVVSFGSNVAVLGEKPTGEAYRIALRDPHDASAYAGILSMTDGEILSVSGDYERYYTIDGARYHHILDPKTGYPADTGLSSVAVVCRDGALADALSTALFVMGEEAALAFHQSGTYDFEAVFIRTDGSLRITEGLAARFTEQ